MELGLYIHIPFCLRKCNYCDFVSFPLSGDAGDKSAHDSYIEGLGREMDLYRPRVENSSVDTVYIGGGTPTVLSVDALAKLFNIIQKNVNLASGAEITVEANPGTLDRQKLDLLREMGVNRLSLGVQSFDESLLASLGRVHGCAEVAESFAMARASGFTGISLDLMYALPGQTMASWRETLRQAVDLAPGHISAYALKIEKNTPFGEALRQGELISCHEDLECAMVEETRHFLAEHGYLQYEISNYARPGNESRHNLKYWRYQPYLGLGAAAHSFMDQTRWANYRDLSQYLAALERGQVPLDWKERITAAMARGEFVMLGLRLREGISRAEFFHRFGEDIYDLYGSAVSKFARLGLLEESGDFLRLTEKGMLLANEVMSAFV